jgi:hypothetical protein
VTDIGERPRGLVIGEKGDRERRIGGIWWVEEGNGEKGVGLRKRKVFG